ncbi:class I SAM-dependent DNA methyltransferase, partial [Rhodoferax sp. 4810]|nr:class I SAM-dependent DNA methyltransferase [Rhodoferax jenense]
AGADLVCYWFEKARAQIETGKARAAGLVATQAIRNNSNRSVLERILQQTRIFHAWSNERWTNDGANVHVAFICFGQSKLPTVLNGQVVNRIYADLTGQAAGDLNCDVTNAQPLPENVATCFEGIKKYGAFDIDGTLARQWLTTPNPAGHHNQDVIKQWRNAQDMMGRGQDQWIIDFGVNRSEQEAACYELPFEYVQLHVRTIRAQQSNERLRRLWWLHERPRTDMRRALNTLPRYIATPRVAKHRIFIWCESGIIPDTRLLVIARADDVNFGVLTSRIHHIWSLATCAWHGGQGATYNANTCFATFPFPIGLTPADTANHAIETLNSGAIIPSVAIEYRAHAIVIAKAAHQLNQLRDHWLNPPDWIDRVPEVVAGYPDRIIAKPEYAAQLKQRALTNLYNQQPAWLVNAHQQLDQAVAAAYGWPTELTDAEILQRLLQLNQARVE